MSVYQHRLTFIQQNQNIILEKCTPFAKSITFYYQLMKYLDNF